MPLRTGRGLRDSGHRSNASNLLDFPAAVIPIAIFFFFFSFFIFHLIPLTVFALLVFLRPINSRDSGLGSNT